MPTDTERETLIEDIRQAESSMYPMFSATEIEKKKVRLRELEIVETKAEEVHNAWLDQKFKAGYHSPSDCPVFLWLTLPERAQFSKFDTHCPLCHPGIYPYEELPEAVKEVDKITVRTVLGGRFLLTLSQELKADLENQQHEREHLLAVHVAWCMLSRQVKIGDTVNVRNYENKLIKATVVEILKPNAIDPLIGISGEGVIGTTFYPQTSLVWDKEKEEFFEITNTEAKRRGYRLWSR